MIRRVENDHKVVVGISKVKYKDVDLCRSDSF